MPKGYFLSAHRSAADPDKRQAYLELALPAIINAGGSVLASTNIVDAHENGVAEQTVLIEFESLEQAKEDDKVKGIYLNLNGTVQAGWANLRSIRDGLLAFKSEGKFIYAYSDLYTEKAYYLASVADEVYLPPEG
ncbi:MAG: DUF1330 domain-containing protein, partial [Pseudomonadota bacterium]